MKIQKCREARLKQLSSLSQPPQQPQQQDLKLAKSSSAKISQKKNAKKKKTIYKKKTPAEVQSTKNIVINYGKAITSFASSELARPYLAPLINQECPVTYDEFVIFAISSRDRIGGIDSFRDLLLVHEKDTEKQAAFKHLLQQISEIFIKYFSVNWIIHGRLKYKLVYLKYRNRMLRRIQKPEHFTYVKKHKFQVEHDENDF